MSSLLSRIMLALFMIPLAALWYITAYIFCVYRVWQWQENEAMVFAGVATWPFVAAYWILLWRRSVIWSLFRIWTTVGAVVGSTIAALILGYVADLIPADLYYRSHRHSFFLASLAGPLLWLFVTCFIWRETAAERAERIREAGAGHVVCPVCGYNLTGLPGTRCPECGTQFTLDDLLARQPGKESAELNQ